MAWGHTWNMYVCQKHCFSYFIPANYLYNIDVFTWHVSRNESCPFFFLSPKMRLLCVETDRILTFQPLNLQYTYVCFNLCWQWLTRQKSSEDTITRYRTSFIEGHFLRTWKCFWFVPFKNFLWQDFTDFVFIWYNLVTIADSCEKWL